MHSNFRLQNHSLDTYYCYYIPILEPRQEMSGNIPDTIEDSSEGEQISNLAEPRSSYHDNGHRKLGLRKFNIILKKIDQFRNPFYEDFLKRNSSEGHSVTEY